MSSAIQTGGPSSGESGPFQDGTTQEPPQQSPVLEPSGVASAETHAPVPAAPPHHHHTLLQSFQSLLYVIIVALFIITFSAQPFRIPSESMEPTLQVGDFLLVDKQVGHEPPPYLFAPAGDIHRGDLVVFHYPIDGSMHLVKRVVGMPGDHLRLRDGRVVIDGHPLDESYAVFRPTAPDTFRDEFPRISSADPGVDSRWWIQMHTLVSHGELTVPADEYFVLGDNRNDSEDSRYWGFVPSGAIVGKPFLVYFSLNSQAPGQAAPSQPDAPDQQNRRNPILNFVRWDRVFRILR